MNTETVLVLDKPCAASADFAPLRERSKHHSTAYSGVRKQFIAAVSAQLLLLVGLAAPKAYTLCHGQTISVEATLYDPFDPFRGEYEDLTFSSISRAPFKGQVKANEAVWVTIAKSPQGQWTATSAAKEKPVLKAGELALKATTTCTDTLSYGIEHLYVPSGTSRNLSVSQQTPLMTEIAVDDSGEACIKQVSYKGHRIFSATDWLHPYSAELL